MNLWDPKEGKHSLPLAENSRTGQKSKYLYRIARVMICFVQALLLLVHVLWISITCDASAGIKIPLN